VNFDILRRWVSIDNGEDLLYYNIITIIGAFFMKMRPEHEKKAVRVLGTVAPFSALSAQKLTELAGSENVQLKEFAVGQQVFPCRSVKDALCVLLSGECRGLSGKRIVSVSGEGALFGAELLYTGAQAEIKVEASQVCRALFISHNAIDMLIEDSSDFARSYIALLSRQLVQAKAESGTDDRAQKVLAEYLLTRPRNVKGEVSLPQDMLRLAKLLGLDKNSFFKAVDKFNSSGAILYNGTSVCIADEEKLKSFI